VFVELICSKRTRR